MGSSIDSYRKELLEQIGTNAFLRYVLESWPEGEPLDWKVILEGYKGSRGIQPKGLEKKYTIEDDTQYLMNLESKKGNMEQPIRGIRWNTPVNPLPESILAGTNDVGSYDNNIALSDTISKSMYTDLCTPRILQSAIDPNVCEALRGLYQLVCGAECSPNGKDEPFGDKIIFSHIIMNEHDGVFNDMIHALMSEVTDYNEPRSTELSGIWDAPRYRMIGSSGVPWHCDLGLMSKETLEFMTEKLNVGNGVEDWNGKPPPSTRKYSIVISLNDAGSYEGGDMEIITGEVQTMKMSVGDVIIYPSFLSTRFLPITSGELLIIKIYNNGAYYK